MAISIGFREYNLTDFSQQMIRCPHCEQQKLFVLSKVDFFQFNSMPIYPKKLQSKGLCRSCGKIVNPGNNASVDAQIQLIQSGIEVPKTLKAGAILYPLAIVSVIAFITAMG